MNFLLIGHGGREASIARQLSFDSCVYSVMGHKNPSLIKYIEQTGGKYLLGDINNSQLITDFAASEKIDLVFVNSDNPLEAGVVDSLMVRGIPVVGPTRAGAEIEWNKTYALELMEKLFPGFTPNFWIANNDSQLKEVIEHLKSENIAVVVKPQGLTGGKGVKVMGEHLADYDAVYAYAAEVLKSRKDLSDNVILVEKLVGIEFTIMGITDGRNLVCAPATYDHPYRYDNDLGPGTGGMGSFNDVKLPLPFMTDQEYKVCQDIMNGVLDFLRRNNRHFNGVLNGGFFLTKQGIKFMEFNARFGDPECINIMDILATPFSQILLMIYEQKLFPERVKFTNKASVVKYLVSPEYALGRGQTHEFTMALDKLEANGIKVHFASAEALDVKDNFKTVGTSRLVALSCSANSITEAALKINVNIKDFVSGLLEYRQDIGSQEELDKLVKLKSGLDN